MGNLDLPGFGETTHRRPAFLMGMDEGGAVPVGLAGRSLVAADGIRPYGPRTRYDLLLEQSDALAKGGRRLRAGPVIRGAFRSRYWNWEICTGFI
ncbi:hypothetical protein LJK87_34135 [Paenibacillus sp. P25]|nr:hypothetical protein LJK87_34135 [Paenibacillus sp. P25]